MKRRHLKLASIASAVLALGALPPLLRCIDAGNLPKTIGAAFVVALFIGLAAEFFQRAGKLDQ